MLNSESLNYTGRKVKIVNFDNWSSFSKYTNIQDYIGKTGTIKGDYGVGGHRFTIRYLDQCFQEVDNKNGRLCFRFENLEFLPNEEIEKEGIKMSVKIEAGVKTKQIKELPGFNYIGDEFEVKEIVNSVVMCANSRMGFGISEDEFLNYFEILKPVVKEEVEFITIVNGIKTTRKGKLTLVELPDGSRGASKCLPQDTYDAQRGYDIAFLKADIRADEKVIKIKQKKLAELRKV